MSPVFAKLKQMRKYIEVNENQACHCFQKELKILKEKNLGALNCWIKLETLI